MPVDDDDLNPDVEGAGDQDQGEEPTFADHLQAAATGAAFLGEHETAKWFSEVEDPADLLDPEAAEHIAKLRQAGTSGRSLGPSGERLADDLTVIADSEHQAKEQRDREEATASRAAMKASLKEELAGQAVTAAKTTEEQRLRDELLAEIRAEENPPDMSPDDEQLRILKDAHGIATDMSRPIEERAAAADRGIAAAAALEANTFRPDRSALASSVEAKLKKLRGE